MEFQTLGKNPVRRQGGSQVEATNFTDAQEEEITTVLNGISIALRARTRDHTFFSDRVCENLRYIEAFLHDGSFD